MVKSFSHHLVYISNKYIRYLFQHKPKMERWYRSGTVNSNMANSKFHFIQSFCEIFARFLSFHVQNAQLIQTQLIQSSTNSKGIKLTFNLKCL